LGFYGREHSFFALSRLAFLPRRLLSPRPPGWRRHAGHRDGFEGRNKGPLHRTPQAARRGIAYSRHRRGRRRFQDPMAAAGPRSFRQLPFGLDLGKLSGARVAVERPWMRQRVAGYLQGFNVSRPGPHSRLGFARSFGERRGSQNSGTKCPHPPALRSGASLSLRQSLAGRLSNLSASRDDRAALSCVGAHGTA
jgi:hypothetical protein